MSLLCIATGAMTKEELEIRRQKILEAIEAIEGGAQEAQLGDVRVRRADLRQLYAQLWEIEKKLAAMSNSYNTRVFVRYVDT